MSTLDPTKILNVAGQLVTSPTQGGLLGAYPFGGNPIGFVVNCELEVNEETLPIWSEAIANKVGSIVGYTEIVFRFKLKQYDTDMLNNLWAVTTTSAGGFTGANTLREPDVGATLQPGVRTPGPPLLFAPNDVNHPATLLFAPIYYHQKSQPIVDAIGDARVESIRVECVKDANGHLFAQDLLQHLSLT